MCIRNGVEDSLASKMGLLEVVRLLLKLLQRVNAAFFETKFARANETSWAVPIIGWNTANRWIKTVAMVTIVATVAKQDVSWIVVGTAGFATLLLSVTIPSTRKINALTSPGRSSADRTRGLVLPGVDWRGCVMCEPATVGASASQIVSRDGTNEMATQGTP